ncbi:MAG: hypothetical protein QOE90_995 [Thermoplasmata archaeon]|jgi:hypothetical protein|nr:hypothetical protein [Thermoplasmata archaeon]
MKVGGCDGVEVVSSAAPDLPVGRSWTYHAKTRYDSRTEITIVVASKNATGYLFAGATADDVLEPLAWGRFTHGPQSLGLNPTEDAVRLFDFPLEEGKTWTFTGNLTVTARATRAGWTMSGATDHASVTYAYAPSVGYLTSMDWRVRNATFVELGLARVGIASKWVWAERGPDVEVGPGTLPVAPPVAPPTGAQTFDVPAKYDGLVVSAGGTRGSLVVGGPGGASWSPTFTNGTEAWDTRGFAAPSGTWSFGLAAGGTNDWVYARAVAVKWIRG